MSCSACVSEIDPVTLSDRLYASIEDGTGTKVYADQDLKLLWNAGDKISVFNRSTYNSCFRFTGQDGDNAGDFEDITASGLHTGNSLEHLYAVYPYSESVRINNSGTTISLTVPAEQKYADNSFGTGANVMVAVTENNFLAFKNVCGYLALKLYGPGVSVGRISIRGNSGEKLSGAAEVSAGIDALPSVQMSATASDSITLVCDPPVELSSGAESCKLFWLAVPPVTFAQGFTITVVDAEGGVFEKQTSKSLTITRNKLELMAPLEVVPDDSDVPIQFADSNFKAFCLDSNFDLNGDGEISRSEARAVTDLDLNYYKYVQWVHSLDGLEYFTNLQSFAYYGNLYDPVLKMYCPELKTVAMYLGNYCEQLHLIDLSGLTSLTSVSIANLSTVPFSVDVSNDIALEYIHVYGGLSYGDTYYEPHGTLESINVSGCTSLKQFSCTSHGSHLNEDGIVGLEDCVDLEEFTGYYNDFRSLDFSGFPKLKSLYLAGNFNLASLNLAGLSELEWMSVWACINLNSVELSGCTGLIELWTTNTAIDFSEVSQLQILTYSCNGSDCEFSLLPELTNLSVWNFSALDLSANTKLSYLHLGSNNCQSLDLKGLPSLESLEIEGWSVFDSVDIRGCSRLSIYNSAECSGLKTLIMDPDQQIEGVTVNRSENNIHPDTEIVVKNLDASL